MIVFSDVPPCNLVDLMIEAASTSVTSVNFYQTAPRDISEDSHLLDAKFDSTNLWLKAFICNHKYQLKWMVVMKKGMLQLLLHTSLSFSTTRKEYRRR